MDTSGSFPAGKAADNFMFYILLCCTFNQRPLKKLPDGYSDEAETGHLLVWLRDQEKYTWQM